jgi:hypothetical protein
MPTLIDEPIHRSLDDLDTVYQLTSSVLINVLYAFMNMET